MAACRITLSRLSPEQVQYDLNSLVKDRYSFVQVSGRHDRDKLHGMD